MPFGTITATESTFGSISGSIVGAVPGTLSGSVGVPGPQGEQGIQGIQGPPGPAGPGSTWGGITGTLSSQTDLQTALDGKYSTTNPSGFITASALSPYLTTATANATFQTLAGMSSYLTTAAAAAGYYPLTGNPSGFLTSAPVTSVAGRTGAITLANTDISGLGTMSTASASNYSTTAVADTLYAPIAAGLPTGGTVGQVLTKNSGTNFDASFATLIPGDRYLTSSTTSLTINNANKTLTIGTGLSYTTQQDIVIAHDAANHMHARVLTYNSGSGVMDVDVLSHSGAGTYAAWTVNVGGAVPEASVAWGSITGTLGSQTDLANALNAKLDSSTAASTYFTIASASGKANLSGATFTGKVNLATIGVGSPSVNLGGQCDSAPASATNGDLWISSAASPKLTYRAGGINYNLAVLNQFNTFTGQMVINTTSSTTAALRVTQLGAGNAIEVEDSTTPDATRFVVDANGKVGIGVAPDASAALKVDSTGIMFGDGTVQNTAALPPVPPVPASPILAFANTIASQITSLIWNINTDGANATIQFTFNLNNASVINRMNQSCGQSTYLSCTFDNGFGFTQTVLCPITGPLSSVTTTDFSESFQYSIGLNGTIRVKLGNDLGYVFYDITL